MVEKKARANIDHVREDGGVEALERLGRMLDA